MADKIVALSRRYEAHGKVFESVTVREPRWEDVLELGEPYELQRAGSNVVIINNQPVIRDYVRRCVVNPGCESLGELGVTDSRAVRDAVMGFFTLGGATQSPPPPTSDIAATS